MKYLMIALATLSTVFSTPARANDDRCDLAKIHSLLQPEYQRATKARCLEGAKGTYILAGLLEKMAEKKTIMTAGTADLINATGFTAIALAGYRLQLTMVHRNERGHFISVHFANPDSVGAPAYLATYQTEEPLF